MTDTEWSVYAAVLIRGPLTDTQLDGLLERFPDAAFDLSPDRVGMQTASTGPDAIFAGELVITELRRALISRHVNVVEVVEVHVRPWADLEAENAADPFADLIAGPAVAELLGVTRQRLHQLQAREDFPDPVLELGGGVKVWSLAGVQAWASTWDRRPGRPSTRPQTPSWAQLEAQVRRSIDTPFSREEGAASAERSTGGTAALEAEASKRE